MERTTGVAGGALLLVALAIAVALSLALGARDLTIAEVWGALTAPSGTDADRIVLDARLPRTITGACVGLALGVAGAVIQGHTRNPLADPGLLGVSAGAAFAVCVGIATAGVTALAGQVWLALAGALGASIVVFVAGSVRSSTSTPVTLALVGVAVTAFLSALTSALLLLSASTLDAFRFWSVGSLAGRDLAVLAQVLPFLVAGLALAVATAPAMNALMLGDDVARGLGQRIALVRVAGIASVALLTAGAVSAAGPIVFVGLVAPHAARMLTGGDHRILVPAAGLVGATVVLLADAIGRVVGRPGEVQVGVAIAFVGAPVFVALVRRRRLAAL